MKSQLLLLFLFLLSLALFAQDPQQGWVFEPESDTYTSEAMLDLSYLNEDVAGENGFVRLSGDGESFVNDAGTIRFFGVGGGDGTRNMTDEEVSMFAKFLAKKGVNMIRFHGEIHSVTNDIMQANAEELDAIWRLVAEMKEEGIYTTISPFWPNFIDQVPNSWEVGDYSGTNKKPWALLYFNDRFQEAYKNWLTQLYTETNPYTGIALKDDPAVGLIQMLNEDGVFFWTIQAVEPSLLAEMESQFHDWLLAKYGSIDDAYAAWDNLAPLDTDNPEEGKMGIYIIFDATIDQTGGKDKRVSDQIAFYTDTQRGFYEEVYNHLREIGCQQLINTTNWKTANSARLLDAERYTNAVADVMAVNRYFDNGHVGPNRGWRFEPGDTYRGDYGSVLFNPHRLPVNVKQVKGKPFIMTESSWPFPNRNVAESIFITTAYSALTGFDTYYWFAPRSSADGYSGYMQTYHTFNDFDQLFEPIYKFNIGHPQYLGTFPANALMYRQGYVQEGETVVEEVRSLQQIYGREIPLITEESGFDPNRDSYDNQGDPTATEVAPLAYLAGKVRVDYDGDPANSAISPELDDLLNFAEKKINSTTGELSWDYEKGLFVLDAPAAQGVTGFFEEGGQVLETSDLVMNIQNEYAAYMVVSMDGQPLSTSEEILVQIITRFEPTGYRESATTYELNDEQVEGFEVERTGLLPWRAAVTDMLLTVKNTNVQSAHLLDENGYKVEEIGTLPVDNGLQIILPDQAMYVVLNTEPASVTALDNFVNDDAWIVYPNPSQGEFSISLDEISCDSITIVNAVGQHILTRQTKNRMEIRIDTKFPPGIYVVRLEKDGQLIGTKKLIVRP